MTRATLALFAILLSLAAVRAEGPPTGYRTGIVSDKDRRVPQSSDAWPWSSIGRVNVVFGSRRAACTGVLVAPDKVATAGHCLFNQGTRNWATPRQAHFVAGVSPGASKADAGVKEIVHADDFDPTFTAFEALNPEMLARDWAIVTLDRPLPLKPVRVEAPPADLTAAETARAGYGSDRPFMLMMQRGCAVAPIAAWPNLLRHDCDTMPGDSGSPILLLRGDDVVVIGLSTAASSDFEPGVGHRAKFGVGVSAAAFVGRLGPPAK